MNEKIKKIVTMVAVIVFVAVAGIWLFGSDVDHIEDTNGDDVYTLQTITDANIINRDIGAIGAGSSIDSISNVEEYHSKKFTGVDEIFTENIVTNRMDITVNHAKVTKGNFRLVLLVNDEIVHDFKLNELTQTYVLEDVKGTVSLRIAGESAEYMFDYWVI